MASPHSRAWCSDDRRGSGWQRGEAHDTSFQSGALPTGRVDASRHGCYTVLHCSDESTPTVLRRLLIDGFHLATTIPVVRDVALGARNGYRRLTGRAPVALVAAGQGSPLVIETGPASSEKPPFSGL